MDHNRTKRFTKLLFFSTLIPASLASACAENDGSKKPTSTKVASNSTPSNNNINHKPTAEGTKNSPSITNQPKSSSTTKTQPVENAVDFINQADNQQAPKTQTTFNDLNNFAHNFAVSSTYANQQADVAWAQLKVNQKLIIDQLKLPTAITNKYHVSIISDEQTLADVAKGVISNIVAVFTINNQYQTVRFDLTGFRVETAKPAVPNNKNGFLTAKTITNNLKNIFPSFLAQMLLFNESSDYQRPINSAKHYHLDFQHFRDNSHDFFTNNIPKLDKQLKTYFFTTKSTDHDKYDYKIVGVKFDDTKGTLSLNVKIVNLTSGPQQEPEIEKQFDFSGFRTIDFNNPQDNILGFSILPSDLKTIFQQTDIKEKLKSLNNDSDSADEFDSINNRFSEKQISTIKNAAYKAINVYTFDNSAYNLAHSDIKLTDLSGLHQGFGLYPFYTKYLQADIVHDFDVYIDNSTRQKMVGVRFILKLPIYVTSSYGTLNDFNFVPDQRTLDINVVKTIEYSKVVA